MSEKENEVTDLEKANGLLRRLVDWETSNTSNLTRILLDAKAYLATQPEPVDPDLLAAREICEKLADDRIGAIHDAILAGIKYGRGA